jgi:ligand-binding SRPBCC domain-containing protein
MKIFEFKQEQLLRGNPQDIWAFFSTPVNLNAITPDNLRFEITSSLEPKLYPGQIISYRIELLPGIKWLWVTEISHVQEGLYFVDEQRYGPYAFWHHKHFFIECKDGVTMIDHIHYALPFDPLGRLFHAAIRGRLEQIFNYRYQVLERKYNA